MDERYLVYESPVSWIKYIGTHCGIIAIVKSEKAAEGIVAESPEVRAYKKIRWEE